MPKLRAAALLAVLLAAACNGSSPNPTEPAATPAASAPPSGPVTQPQLSPDEVISIVASRYPDRLAAGVSGEQRVANMEFLRDRIIEVGICGGLDLAWNRKSNGGRSVDALDWKHGENNALDVVDLALAYDDTSRPLALHWQITEGPAGWDPYPAPACPVR